MPLLDFFFKSTISYTYKYYNYGCQQFCDNITWCVQNLKLTLSWLLCSLSWVSQLSEEYTCPKKFINKAVHFGNNIIFSHANHPSYLQWPSDTKFTIANYQRDPMVHNKFWYYNAIILSGNLLCISYVGFE